MNTPAHLIFGLAAFGRADQKAVTAAALVGALIPDLSLYVLSVWHLAILETPARVVFGELYFSSTWQNIFRIDNSILLWSIALGVAAMARSKVGFALCGAALLHLFLDFPLHHDDGRAHFWPITNWIFQSPVSYWDPNHHGQIVGALEIGAALIACVVLWRRFRALPMRALIVLLGILEAAPAILWAFVFSQ